jgi:hypothetical protein
MLGFGFQEILRRGKSTPPIELKALLVVAVFVDSSFALTVVKACPDIRRTASGHAPCQASEEVSDPR